MAAGADLLRRMAADQRLRDGSYLSHVYPSGRDWRHKTNGIMLRVIDYRLEGIEDAEPIYRLATTVLDPGKARAGLERKMSNFPLPPPHIRPLPGIDVRNITIVK